MSLLRCSLVLIAAALVSVTHAAEPTVETLPDGVYAVIDTRRGTITAELFFETAPLTVANFVGLAEGTIPFEHRPAGVPFFDGLKFHRVVPGFVVQGGDPLGTGEGGPGYRFQDEFSPALKHDTVGILSMANAGPNDNGSQFFITLAPSNRLNYKHAVFGRVVRGLDVLPRIRANDVMERITIHRVGAKAEAFRPDANSFARLRETTRTIEPRSAELPPLYAENARMPQPDYFPRWLNQKLHHYAAVTGYTIWTRVVPRLAPPAEGASTRHPVRHLHEQLAGNDPRAATLVFVAAERRWYVWLGEALLDRFQLGGLSVEQEGDHPDLRALKTALLASAQQLLATEPHRSVETAVTDLMEALDRPDSLNAARTAAARAPR